MLFATAFLVNNMLSPDHLGKFFYRIFSYIFPHICNYSGLLIVFAFFRKYQASFTSSTRLGASLQYIGRRTLDIYLLHYFFIPSLSCFGEFFRNTPNMLLELVSGLIFSLLIAGLCLLISNIIRISDLLGHYLFGAKISTPKPQQ